MAVSGMYSTNTEIRFDNDPYFNWLCGRVGITPYRNRYLEMAKCLYSIKWRDGPVELDRNRAMDGLNLRSDYIQGHPENANGMNRGQCTMLEFLIALAKRMNFLMSSEHEEHKTAKYFWIMISNLGLDRCNDDNWYAVNGEFRVEEAMTRLLDRTYDADGKGGLFPLQFITADQRTMEIWYQMQCWLTENADNLLD